MQWEDEMTADLSSLQHFHPHRRPLKISVFRYTFYHYHKQRECVWVAGLNGPQELIGGLAGTNLQ